MRYSAFATLLVVALASCADSPIETADVSPAEPPLLSRASGAAGTCTMTPPGQQIRELQKAVERLPGLPSFYSRTRLLPRLADAQRGVDRRDAAAAAASLKAFQQEIGALRLHVPLDHVIPLLDAARCATNALGSPAA